MLIHYKNLMSDTVFKMNKPLIFPIFNIGEVLAGRIFSGAPLCVGFRGQRPLQNSPKSPKCLSGNLGEFCKGLHLPFN
ncbi:hypothetical protein NEILACOT_03832 [Neisseria lactamica ATCC 23970]|uniref:Uncharacterized protein n=1 Tax=Neisseria lactamica ATCC 23970 TaxID=546265 RepID=D0W8H8_NEILA|nr:hypothetical protein NEILACOT_03832 [Neisseria lactamica ATCC 23970]